MIIKPQILIRADGSPEIGMGHFIRSLALARMLKDDFYTVFAISKPTDFQKSEIRNACNECLELKPDSHFDDFLSILTGNEMVLLDNYFFTSDYQNKITNKGCKLVCIDDNHAIHFFANIVINHSPAVSPKQYQCEPYTRLLLGLEYALLRTEYLESAGKDRQSDSKKEALVCFGGSDPENLSLKYSEMLLQSGSFDLIHVVYGIFYKYKKELFDFSANAGKKISLHENLSPKEMISLAQNCRVAIVPSSGIMMEMIAVKIPIITGYYVENQKEIALNIGSPENGIFSLGNMNAIASETFGSAISAALSMPRDVVFSNQKKLIDGNSGLRIKKELLSLLS